MEFIVLGDQVYFRENIIKYLKLGCGKTFLMDLFYESVPIKEK